MRPVPYVVCDALEIAPAGPDERVARHRYHVALCALGVFGEGAWAAEDGSVRTLLSTGGAVGAVGEERLIRAHEPALDGPAERSCDRRFALETHRVVHGTRLALRAVLATCTEGGVAGRAAGGGRCQVGA